jgi:four helix bundle protein
MDLEIWQEAVDIADRLFDLAEKLERKKLYRFAEQLRGSGLSMSNNIAEGSGSNSKREFLRFLNIARRATFENANQTSLNFSNEKKPGIVSRAKIAKDAKIEFDKKRGRGEAFASLACLAR